MPEPRKPVMTVAGTRVSSACASKVASERCREKTFDGGGGRRRRGDARLRKHLEKESRGRWRRAEEEEEEAAVLVALGISSRAAAAAMSDVLWRASRRPWGFSWGLLEQKTSPVRTVRYQAASANKGKKLSETPTS